MNAPVPADRRLAFLHEVASILQGSTDLDEILGPVLRLLSERVRFHGAALAVRDRVRDEVALYAAHGLTPAEIQRERWRPGEWIVGSVAESGRPEVVRSVLDDERTASEVKIRRDRVDRAFLCVPIRTEDAVLGTLSAYRPVNDDLQSLEDDVRLLEIVAGLLVPATQRAVYLQERDDAQESDEVMPTGIVGRSKAMRAVFELVAQVAPSPATALLLGESGTGKELIANAIHRLSPRARRTFVKINCAALPEAVIESELFGHERGAFTGAHQQRKGRFELADHGTLFLDEIGDLSPGTQVKLLRVLQEGEFQRVGGNKTIRVDVRIIAATSRNLSAMIEAGSFRSDLYYRLNVFPVHIPALRERRADILLLCDFFVETFNKAHGRNVRRVATSAIDMLMAYHWPGNVRELENCIERSVLLARGDAIQGHHLPPTLQTPDGSDQPVVSGLKGQVDAFERDLVQDALKLAGGNMASAARRLGISERIMGLRVNKYGLDPRRFRS